MTVKTESLRIRIPAKHRQRITEIAASMNASPDVGRANVTLQDVVLQAMVLGFDRMKSYEPPVITVWLHDFGPRKIDAIKAWRSVTGADLREAKLGTESAPCEVSVFPTVESAHDAARAFTEAGACAEVRRRF